MVPFTPVRSCVQTGCDRQRRGWVGWGVGGEASGPPLFCGGGGGGLALRPSVILGDA